MRCDRCYLDLVAARSCQYLLDDFGLGVRIVLCVLPGAGCQSALCLFVEQSIFAMSPKPVTEQQHLLDFFTPVREDMQVSLWIW